MDNVNLNFCFLFKKFEILKKFIFIFSEFKRLKIFLFYFKWEGERFLADATPSPLTTPNPL